MWLKLKLKFYFWRHRIYVREVLKVRSRIERLIYSDIFYFVILECDDIPVRDVDYISYNIYCDLFGRSVGEQEGEYNDDLNKCADRIKKSIFQKFDVSKVLSRYYALTAFYYSCGGSCLFLSEIEENNSKALSLDAACKPLTIACVNNLDKEVSVGLKRNEQRNKVVRKDVIGRAVDKITPKVEINSGNISFVISISVSLFVVTGYFYNKFYLGYFGIEVSDFYTLGDYLSSSLDKISLAIYPAIIAVGAYLAGMYKGVNDLAASGCYRKKQNYADFHMFIFCCVLNVMLIYFAYVNHPNLDVLFYIDFVFLSMSILHVLPLERFILNHLQVRVVLVAVMLFSINVYRCVKDEIKGIESGSGHSEYSFIFSDKQKGIGLNPRLLASTSAHYFVYSKDKEAIFVVNKSDVELVRIMKL